LGRCKSFHSFARSQFTSAAKYVIIYLTLRKVSKMLIYLLSQNKVRGYDTFDSCVVVADNEEAVVIIDQGIIH
jgi:hypothetical protein